MMYNNMRYLFFFFFLAFMVLGCSEPGPESPSEADIPDREVFSGVDEVDSNLTAGDVRQALFKSLHNTTGLAACFDGGPLIQFSPLSGKDTYQVLEKKLNLQEDSSLTKYLDGLREYPGATKSVMVRINGKEVRQFVYIPNDGSYGIKIIQGDDTDVDLGILVDIMTPVSNVLAKTKTCVTCIVESGKKGEGCTCTQTTKTNCCSTPGCSPTCGTLFQCKWNCNRDGASPTDLCESTAPFEDNRPFVSFSPGDKF